MPTDYVHAGEIPADAPDAHAGIGGIVILDIRHVHPTQFIRVSADRRTGSAASPVQRRSGSDSSCLTDRKSVV